jgi:hypothetical protein
MSHPLLYIGARFMKIDLTLDYQTILRNEPRPVHRPLFRQGCS